MNAPGKRRILIVDDNPEDRQTYRRFLSHDEEFSYDIQESSSVHRALEYCRERAFDCILVDYNMPDENGLEFLEGLKAIGGSQRPPLIMLTGTGNEEVAVEAMKRGALDYLVKNNTTAISLRHAVNTAIYKAHTDRLLAEQQGELERLYREAQSNNARKDEILAELKAAKEAAERASATKDEFLAALSHELRTPLTPVLAGISALVDAKGIDPTSRDLLEMVKRNVKLEARLIDDLLDLTRITNKKLQLEWQRVDLHELIRHAVSICTDEGTRKTHSFTLALAANYSIVCGDSTRLQQVLWNLLKNAIKFTPAAGRIVIETENPDFEHIRVRVKDNGIGIAPEALEKIFHAFEQGESAINRQYGGLGLGLAITRALVESHEGIISAESAGRDNGSTFTLELKLSREPVEGAVPDDDGQQDDRQTVDSPRVLLVEDHADTSKTFSRLLRAQGYDVLTAASCAEAIEVFRGDEKIGTVLSDLGLPDGSGHDLIRAMKKIRPVDAIALSGYGMEDDLMRSREAGFRDHLIKPIDLLQLRRVLGPNGLS